MNKKNIELFNGFQNERSVETIIDTYGAKKTKYDVDKYFMPENFTRPVNEYDITNYIIFLKQRYPELCKFKYVARFHSRKTLSQFIKYAKEHPETVKDAILGINNFIVDYDKDHPRFESITIIDKFFGFSYKSNYIGENLFIFLFFNDKNKILKKFFAEHLYKHKPNIYELLKDSQGGYYTQEIDLKYSEPPILDSNILKQLENDIELFFSNKQFYIKHKLAYKRGVMLYGAPGNGKTLIIKHLLSKSQKYYILLVSAQNFSDSIYSYINSIFPEDGQKIMIFEDIDSLEHWQRSEFLNFIDGIKTPENIIFIATTNYPELVDSAIINRPSRFDRIYRIDAPSKESRKQFLLKFFPRLNEKELNKYAEMTSKFSGAYFTELFKAVNVQKLTIKEAIEQLNKQINICKSKNFEEKEAIGFGGDF